MTASLHFADSAQVDNAEWDRHVELSPDGWVFALSGWQRLILAVPPWGLSDVSFAAYRGERLAAVVPLQYQPASRRLGSSGWGLAGPVLAAGLDADSRHQVFRGVMAHVSQVASQLGAATVEMGRPPMSRRARAGDTGIDSFEALGYADTSTQTRIIDLDAAEDTLWQGLSKNARQMVKKATALGYRVERGDWPGLVDNYYRVHCETYERTGVQPHPREYFDGIAREMAPRGHAVLWVGHAPDGGAVAFHNDARLGPGALYHTGCSATAHLDSGINYLLMWEAIRAARAGGCRWYEVGEVFAGDADRKSRGLSVFKSKFGGEVQRSTKARLTLVPESVPAVSPQAADHAEASVRAAYAAGDIYAVSRICRQFDRTATDYVDRLLQERFAMVEACYRGGTVLDLCCATGAHLVDISGGVDRAVGVDFSARYLVSGRALAADRQRDNVHFVQGDARRIPVADAAVELVYCFSSLYAIPRAEEVVAEVARVLKPGGHAVLDFGNRRSLNVFCLRYYTEWPPLHPLSVAEIKTALSRAGLRVVEHRRFQLLPLWTDRPAWLWPLLHPFWNRLLRRRLFGRMLDEWVSSLPILRALAFRHLMACRKV